MSFINVGSYESMCEVKFKKQAPAKSCVVYCHTEETLDFFKTCRNKKYKYILVSACSDYGIHYQREAHPNKDLSKQINRVDWNGLANEIERYVKINLSAVLEDNCRASDFYSVKVDSLTHHTFTEIPENIVKWYSTNLDVVHPKITMIPFGVNNEGHGFQIVESHRKPMSAKLDKLYVNFQDYTVERLQLKQYFSNPDFASWVTFRDKVGLSVDKFYDELASHKFILCPFGNGMDCYRIYESLILGSIPVVKQSIFSDHLLKLGLPLIIMNNFGITQQTFEGMLNNFNEKKFDFDPNTLLKITEEYWAEEFKKDKDNLL